jgi:hypothetical protein
VDAGHTVGDVSIDRTVSDTDVNVTNEVAIKEEGENKTGGHFKAVGFDFSVPASIGTHIKDFTMPTPRSLLLAQIDVADAWIGDVVSLHIAPDTGIGPITAGATAGDTVFNVFGTVIGALKIGYLVKIGGQDCGECINIDAINNQITTSEPIPNNASVNDPVQMTIEMGKNIKFTTGGVTKNVGDSKIGGSYISSNIVIRAVYENKQAIAKEFHFAMEMLY